MATIRKRNNTYQIRVSAGYDSTGKQIIKTKTWKPSPGMTNKQIEKELAKQAVLFEQQVETGQFLDGTITLAEFSEKWFKEYAEKHLKEKSLTGYMDMMPRIIQALGHIRLAKLQPNHLMEFYNNLGEAGVRRDIKYKACDDFRQIVKAEGYTQKSLSEAAVLDDEQVQELIKCLNDEPMKYKTAIMLILYTGLRRGELLALGWDDIDLNNGIIHITKNLLYTPKKGLYEDTTKTRQSQRVVNIPDDMVSLLKLHRQEQNILRLAIGEQWQGSGKVFTSDTGGAIRPDTFSTWYKNFVRRHNLPDSHVHTLRHISATLLIAGGVDIATVSSRLGHASKTTTWNIYTHAIQSRDALAAEKLQDIFNPTKRYDAI